MKKLYNTGIVFIALTTTLLFPKFIVAQVCDSLKATYVVNESRCAATGTIEINATGGSGNYKYKATGPVVINYTSSNIITGLSAGNYVVTVFDITTNCVYNKDTVTVLGNYLTPNFTMTATGVTCINGNNGTISLTSQNFGRGPFSYTIIAPSPSAVGSTNVNGMFNGLTAGNYLVQLSDSCGGIQTRSIIIDNYSWNINSYTVTKIGCDSISVTNIIKDSKNNTTPSAAFSGFLYGVSIIPGDTSWFTTNSFGYHIGTKHTVNLFVKDNCGNIKSASWSDPAIPSVGGSISVSNKACSTFTATVTGQSNLTSPQYCIYDNTNTLVTCNTTGVFNLLPYGKYSIKITNSCYDTIISRNITVTNPVPSVATNVAITTICKFFTASITGQTNLSNPNYCLYDSNDVLITCNTTGIFPNQAVGRYCIRIVNNTACYDTTITRCFTVTTPIPGANTTVAISNLACATFTATIRDTVNWNNPQFCLFTPAHVLITCNSTGVFTNLPYGSYCIDIVNGSNCYDTTITRCFTVNRPLPSVANTVAISNKNCTGFTASITGQTNLNSPQYCLYDSLDTLVSCNSTGIFTNVPFGDYCINIQNDPACYDTLIKRCFSVLETPTKISLSSTKSCTTIGNSDIKVTFVSGTPAYSVSLFSPSGALMQTISTSASTYTFVNVPGLASSLTYKIVATGLCGIKDSSFINPVISVLDRVITFNTQCPSAKWTSGSADVLIDITGNNIGGTINSTIISKNFSPVSINPTSASGYTYTFADLGPAIYIFDTYVNTCSRHFYDTVTVKTYVFPDLYGTKAYQCSNQSFTVNANAINGKAPYMYEIFGSSPALPSIISAPQASPVFTINNGSSYSLIRLRVLDACGNASLYDASVLPLANFIVYPQSQECFNQNLSLKVDSIPNADYYWYKRTDPNDSTLVGSGATLYFPSLLISDTGRYFSKVVVNNGCLEKYSNYVLTGFCGVVLPINIKLNGSKQNDANKLYWNKGTEGIKEYGLERISKNGIDFQAIARITNNGSAAYSFVDNNPLNGNNIYRLKFTDFDNKIKYSNTVSIKNSKSEISLYPNPVNGILYISVANTAPKDYVIEINNLRGQKISSKRFDNIQNAIIEYPRSSAIIPGVYSISITDILNHEKKTYKIIYK
jgi:hypothetical protein